MKRAAKASRPSGPSGPSQRQLRAGELVRHALVEILREETFLDPTLAGVIVTVTEVRMTPDLRHAMCFVQPLRGENAKPIIKSLNAVSKYIRGLLGRMIDMKFTPDLRFIHDQSFATAEHIEKLFDDPRVRADIAAPDEDEEDGHGPA
jgi:ribosome-binding factor A